MLLLKLALVPLSVWLSSLAGRHFGHAVAGVLSGLPMIAGPMIAVLLLDHDAQIVAPISAATARAIPAMPAFLLAFAWLATRASVPVCLAGAAASFVVVGSLLTALRLPSPWVEGLALISPMLALMLMPEVAPLRGPVPIPRREIAFRMLAATAIGALILYGASHFPPAVNGLLLSWPITGTILPAFTLPLHGRVATINLLRGFANGLIGFSVFFCSLHHLLAAGTPKWAAYAAAIGAAVLTAWSIYRWRILASQRRPTSRSTHQDEGR